MSESQPELSSGPFELRVRTYAGLIVNRHTASQLSDGRYFFFLTVGDSPAECADPVGPNTWAKGHVISEDGFFEILAAYCESCKRPEGKHVRPGHEVRQWLDHMPTACQEYWQALGCDGGGFITIGGDSVQGYAVQCKGCDRCNPTGVR